MFGNKNSKESSGSTSSSPSKGPNSINSIVAGTVVEGNIKAESDIRIDGTLTGKLQCSGRVIIGVEGKVKGEIICQNAVIEGDFDGDLKVKDNLQVKGTAKITGDVDVDKLNVSAGAVFNVVCNMGSSNLKTISKNGVPEPIQIAN